MLSGLARALNLSARQANPTRLGRRGQPIVHTGDVILQDGTVDGLFH